VALPHRVVLFGSARVRPTQELLVELAAGDALRRSQAAYDLASAGEVGTDVVEALLAALDDANESVRENASWALFHVAHPALQYEILFDTRPQALNAAKPVYPSEALGRRIQGTVVVEALVSARGTVVHAEVRQSIPALDAAAVGTVYAWTFRPASRKGKPVPAAVSAPVAFQIP
jgi:protein TonB